MQFIASLHAQDAQGEKAATKVGRNGLAAGPAGLLLDDLPQRSL